MMKLSVPIVSAIKAALRQIRREGDGRGAQKKLAARIGVPANYITRWTKPGKEQGGGAYPTEITQENWEKLLPAIKEFLPADFDPHETVDDNLSAADSRISTKKTLSTSDLYGDLLSKLPPGQQIITGVINVNGVPNEKIYAAINSVNLTDTQRKELILKIFS